MVLTTLFGDLGRLLRTLRNRAGRSQQEAAKHLGKTWRAISGYETEEIAIAADVLDRLLVFYGVADLAQLQGEIDALRSGRPAPRNAAATEMTASESEVVMGLARELIEARKIIDALRNAKAPG